jgi:hypothetical protein
MHLPSKGVDHANCVIQDATTTLSETWRKCREASQPAGHPKDPIATVDGHVYKRKCIVLWSQGGIRTSPRPGLLWCGVLMNVTRCCAGEVCPQPVEEVLQCGFRVHFDFGELWGAVTSPLLLFVLLKAAQSGHRHKKKFLGGRTRNSTTGHEMSGWLQAVKQTLQKIVRFRKCRSDGN